MSRITMSAASFSAASAAILLASWAVLLRRSSPLPTRISLARALAVKPFGGDEGGDGVGHEAGRILAARDRLADRGRGQIDRLHLELDDIGARRRRSWTGRDDDRRQLAHALGRVPTRKARVVGSDDQEEPSLGLECRQRV